MEEKNNVISLVGSNQETTEKKPETKKLSYEELNNVAVQLSNENRQLTMQNRQMQAYIENINRLDYLFKVLKNAAYFEENFIEKCSKEIREALTLPENNNEETETSNNEE